MAKRAAAHRAIMDHLKPEFKAVGIGSGSTVVFCVERIKQLMEEGKISKDTVFVPTGYQSKDLILAAQLPLREINQFSGAGLDIVFDGADEIDEDLNCIKGGGACQFQEKLVGLSAKKFVIVADETKVSTKLCEKRAIPVEVMPQALNKIIADLKRLGASEVILRDGGHCKAGPVITDNGNFILDARFVPLLPDSVCQLDQQIKLLTGVVETGLFTYAKEAYIGDLDGSFRMLYDQKNYVTPKYN